MVAVGTLSIYLARGWGPPSGLQGSAHLWKVMTCICNKSLGNDSPPTDAIKSILPKGAVVPQCCPRRGYLNHSEKLKTGDSGRSAVGWFLEKLSC